MYGLDKNEDLSFLIHRKLQQVRGGPYSLRLRFDESTTIAVEASISIDGRLIKDENLGDASNLLLKSLGSHITSICNLGDGDLTLMLSSGQHLVIHDSERNYESYHINTKD